MGRLAEDSLSVRARGFRPDGTERFAELVVGSGLGDQDVFPRVAVAGDGSFVVVWERGMREIRARGFGADGTARFGEIAVNSHPAGGQMLADVAMNPTGSFVVVWTDDRDENALRQLRARAFEPDGRQGRPRVHREPARGRRPATPARRAGPVRALLRGVGGRRGPQRRDQIHATGFTPALAPFLSPVTVNAVWTGQQRRPAVAGR